MSPVQRTISKEVTLEGVGVHSGESASLTFRPAEPDTGVVFKRVDLDGTPEVPADLDHVVETELGTTLGVGETRVLTVEHLLAALAAGPIDNVSIEVHGPEIPIRDGSFAEYVRALDDAGPTDQADTEAAVLTFRTPFTLQGESGQSYVVAPHDGLKISAAIDFVHPCIGRQAGVFPVDPERFRSDLAPARTFGFKADAASLHAKGLALGASLENAVVLDEDGVMNDALRFEDEFLRHKVGDIVGDLALLGARVNAHIVADRPSHAGNVAVARKLRSQARRDGPPVADTARIMQFLPHRYPMLLIDRIIDFESGKSIVGIKNVTINEPFFEGHYPGHPIMPGVLTVEAMAQCGGLLLMDQVEVPENYVVYFMTMDNVKFRRPVVPGDTVEFQVDIVQFRRKVCSLRGKALVDGRVVAEADLKARIMER